MIKAYCEKYPYRKHYFFCVLKRVFFSGFQMFEFIYHSNKAQEKQPIYKAYVSICTRLHLLKMQLRQ